MESSREAELWQKGVATDAHLNEHRVGPREKLARVPSFDRINKESSNKVDAGANRCQNRPSLKDANFWSDQPGKFQFGGFERGYVRTARMNIGSDQLSVATKTNRNAVFMKISRSIGSIRLQKVSADVELRVETQSAETGVNDRMHEATVYHLKMSKSRSENVIIKLRGMSKTLR
jgi:hypothetical protein